MKLKVLVSVGISAFTTFSTITNAVRRENVQVTDPPLADVRGTQQSELDEFISKGAHQDKLEEVAKDPRDSGPDFNA